MSAGKAARVFLRENKWSYSKHLFVCWGEEAGRAGALSVAEGWAVGCSRPWDAKGEVNHLLMASPPTPQPGWALLGEGFLDASVRQRFKPFCLLSRMEHLSL